MKYLAILGRQADLSLAELEAVCGAENIKKLNNQIASLKNLPDIDRLGGTMRLAEVLTTLDTTDPRDIFDYLKDVCPEYASRLPDGKLKVGIGWYGFEKISQKKIKYDLLDLKKVIKNSGRSIRIIESRSPALETAQVLYNKLTSEMGWEFLMIKNNHQTILAQTTAVQNIDNYAKRDQARPARDAKVGMLPPKLAQIMLNLCQGQLRRQGKVADIFCGTGVVLQEALLNGAEVFGSDLSERMIEYTQTNLDWLKNYHTDIGKWQLQVADAQKVSLPKDTSCVVSEMYLGEPLHQPPSRSHIRELLDENEQLLIKTLQNLARQLPSKTNLCLAIPAWQHSGQRVSVLNDPKIVETIEKIGYTFMKFSHINSNSLIYARENQVVGRQLLIIRRK